MDYKRDVSHTYMILHQEGELNTTSYQVRMLLANTIPGLLSCKIGKVDRNTLFYYDVTSRQSLQSILEYRSVSGLMLQKLLGQLLNLLEELEKYLLSPEGLLILPEVIFADAEQHTFSFCYLPGQTDAERSLQQELQNLMEYLLPKLDHQDPQAVVLGYGLYREVTSGTFSADEIRSVLYRNEGEETEKTPAKHEEELPPVLKEEPAPDREAEAFVQSPERGRVLRGGDLRLAAALLFVLALAAVWILYRMELPGVWYLIPALMGLAAFALLGAGNYLLRKSQHNTNTDARSSEKEAFWDTEIPAEYDTPVRPPQEHYGKICLEEEYQTAEEEQPEALEKTELLSPGRPSGLRLLPVDPPGMPVISLHRDHILIGKLSSAADVVLPYGTISRLHARIQKIEDGYAIVDLNSRNGTYVNGTALKSEELHELKEGDEVAFADRRYRATITPFDRNM